MSVGVGVLGTGVMGSEHARLLSRETPDAHLAGVFDANAARAQAAAAGATVFPDPKSLIKSDRVGAVIIASPDASHAELNLAVLEAGKSVLCEKPLASSAAEALRVVQAEVALKRRLIQVGYMRRFDPGYQEMKRIKDEGGIGATVLLHNIHRNVRAPEWFTGPMAVTNSFVHEVDVSRWLTGSEMVSAHVASGPGGQTPDATFHPLLYGPSAKLGRELMINYAVVGAGWISQQAFLPGVVQSGDSRVAAIVTGARAKAARLADFYGIGMVVGYDGYDALLASPAIDAAYIALPNHMHAEYAIRAARAGKHVMVEKPLAVSEDEALAMIAAARSANVFLMTAYRLHHEPGTVAVLEHIRANAIGRPLFFQSVFSFQTPPENHRLRAMAWGGPLQDVGVYCINAARHIFAEEPIEAIATAHRPADDPRFGEADASVAAMLRFHA